MQAKSHIAFCLIFFLALSACDGNNEDFILADDANEIIEPLQPAFPTNTLNGVFTVNASGKKVVFSTGNLYYENATTWGIEKNQYNIDPNGGGMRNGNHITHFLWCANTYKPYAQNYESTWNKSSPFFAANAFSVAGDSSWFTLSVDEWKYLLTTRTVNGGTGSGKCYSLIKDNVKIDENWYYGLFIYPDDYSGDLIDDPKKQYTLAQLSEAGIVFLPVAGYRFGEVGPGRHPENVQGFTKNGVYGYYWSSTPKDEGEAYCLYFKIEPYGIDFKVDKSMKRSYAISVRLVKEYEPQFPLIIL